MKTLLTLFVLLFSFSVVAEDISDFEIEGISILKFEGMSIGDSLLDYFPEDLIIENIVEPCLTSRIYCGEIPEFVPVYFNNNNIVPYFKTYDSLLIYIKPYDRSFRIYSINGIIDFKNIHDCKNKRDEI